MALVQKTVLETILIRFTDAGQIQGIAAVDKAGIVDDATGAWVGSTVLNPAREIAASDLTTAVIDPTLAAQQATITDLQKQLAAAVVPVQAPANTDDSLLASLNAAFATVPAADQAQFANEYATVRVLIQAGQPALAAAVVQGVVVPDALAEIKAQILAALTGGASS